MAGGLSRPRLRLSFAAVTDFAAAVIAAAVAAPVVAVQIRVVHVARDGDD